MAIVSVLQSLAARIGTAEVDRRLRFTALMREEQTASEDVENLARRLLRAQREDWETWLERDTREALAMAINRLDVTRARLATLQEA